MKKLISIILCLLVFYGAGATEPRLAVWGAYSYGKAITIEPRGTTTFDIPHYGPRQMLADKAKSGVSMGLDYRLTSKVWVGASFTTCGKYTETAYVSLPGGIPIISASYKSSTVYLNAKVKWFTIKNLHFYSRTGIGIGFTSKIDAKITKEYAQSMADHPSILDYITVKRDREPCKRLAWQFSPVGAEYKPIRNIGIFAEGALGNQGNLLAGARFYFL